MMKRMTMKSLLVALVGTLAVATAYAAGAPTPGSAPVTVVNTPLPVTITNPTTGGGANVTVTNPATNPVKTSIDQYPRTPFVASLINNGTAGPSINVNSDQRLVVETVSYSGFCTLGDAFNAVVRLGSFRLKLVLIGTLRADVSVVQNVRVVVDRDQRVDLGERGRSAGCVPESENLDVAGYLVDVNSPSLAP